MDAMTSDPELKGDCLVAELLYVRSFQSTLPCLKRSGSYPADNAGNRDVRLEYLSNLSQVNNMSTSKPC